MELIHNAYNRVDVIALKGRLAADTKAVLSDKLDEIFDAGRHRIVLDLAELDYISSPGLRVLIEARKRAKEGKE